MLQRSVGANCKKTGNVSEGRFERMRRTLGTGWDGHIPRQERVTLQETAKLAALRSSPLGERKLESRHETTDLTFFPARYFFLPNLFICRFITSLSFGRPVLTLSVRVAVPVRCSRGSEDGSSRNALCSPYASNRRPFLRNF